MNEAIIINLRIGVHVVESVFTNCADISRATVEYLLIRILMSTTKSHRLHNLINSTLKQLRQLKRKGS